MEPTDTSPSAATSAENRRFTLQDIPVDKIKPSPFQVRKDFKEDSLLELSENIGVVGLIQPITVRFLPDGTPELVAGERRWRAIKKLGWKTIPAIVQEGVTDEDATVKGLVENLHQKSLTPIEEATGYKQLADKGKDNSEIGRLVGKSRVVISRTMDLLDLPLEIQGSVTRGTLTETHTRALRKISDQKQQIALAKQAADEGWSVKETEKRVNALIGSPQKAEGKGKKGGQKPEEVIIDPVEDVWSKARGDMDFIRETLWEVKYGPYKTEQGFMKDGWNFWISPCQHVRAELAVALHKLGDAVAATADPEELKEAALSLEERNRQIAQVNQQMAQTTLNVMGKIRLPQTPQEQAELESVSARGPRAAMEWIYGQGSPFVLASPLTWKEIGESDPVQGLKGILDGIRRTQAAAGTAPAPALPAAAAPSAAQVPPAPPAAEPPIDEERARRIAAIKAKYGRIL